MLATEKIKNAFQAIVEEAEKIMEGSAPEDVKQSAKTIISIARHQSDVRGASAGSCTSTSSHCGCK